MRVAFFSNHFAASNSHGVATYARNLVRELSGMEDLSVTPVATGSNLSPPDLSKLVQESGLRVLPWGRKVTPLAWTFMNYPPIEQWLDPGIDIVHLAALGFPVATRLPLVITVHDIGPLTHPEFFSIAPPWLLKRSLKQLINQAAAIICVSQTTADELVGYVKKNHGVDLTPRIEVIHEGVEEVFFEVPDQSADSVLKGFDDGPFVLMAGKISPRKNVQGVLAAFKSIPKDLNLRLVVVGGSGWDDHVVHDVLRDPSLAERVTLLDYVSLDQLRALYRAAAVYVHPSLFEGFGLTVLEAMASGCPVITSNVFSLPEVAGDAAVYVDPADESAIANAILEVCSGDRLSADLRQKGFERAREFCWNECAKQTRQVYQRSRGW